ncbi:hypothetical protein ACWDA7_51275 [Streptomyces sp. NPDC001156]
MIVLQPVLEIYASDGFTLWPVTESELYGFLPLSGALDPAEVGTAVMRIADYNDIDPETDGRPPRPADPLGGFLHGLLTMDDLVAPGGLRISDTATGTTLLPGCCNGLDEWRDWLEVVDGRGWPPSVTTPLRSLNGTATSSDSPPTPSITTARPSSYLSRTCVACSPAQSATCSTSST